MDIPIELFSIFLALNLVFIGIGVAKKMPVLILSAGVFIITLSALTDNIIMDRVPTSSTDSGSSHTYLYTPSVFKFTEWPKTLFSLVGAIMMLIGVGLSRIDS